MSNVNCHARSKQKRKKLRLKNLLQRIYTRIKEALNPKPQFKNFTVRNIAAKKVAIRVHHTYTKGYDHQHAMQLNQRQKRKRKRQANGY